MWKSTFVQETIFSRPVRLEQMERLVLGLRQTPNISWNEPNFVSYVYEKFNVCLS